MLSIMVAGGSNIQVLPRYSCILTEIRWSFRYNAFLHDKLMVIPTKKCARVIKIEKNMPKFEKKS